MKNLAKGIIVTCLTIFNCAAFAQELKWAIRAGGAGNDRNIAIGLDGNKNIYAGVTNLNNASTTFNEQCTITGGAASWNATLCRFDSLLNCGMSKYFVAGGSEIRGIQVDDSGYVYVTGYFAGSKMFCSTLAASNNDIFVAKYDANGNCVWANKAGGTGSDNGWGLNIDGDGNVYATGNFQGTANFGGISLVSQGATDGFIAKYNRNGTIQWAKKFGGTSTDEGYGVSNVVNGELYVTGLFNAVGNFGSYQVTGNDSADIFLAKLDTSGNFLWVKGAGSKRFDWGGAVKQDNWGNVFLAAGCHDGTIFGNIVSLRGSVIVRYNSAGQEIWGRSLCVSNGGTTQPGIILRDSSIYHEATFTSSDYTGPSNGGTDIFTAKLDYAGNVIWAQGYGGTGTESGYGISEDIDGAIYVTGQFASPLSVNGATLPPNGASDAILLKIVPSLLIKSVAGGTNKVCGADTFNVGYAIYKTYNPGNVFTVQLSDTSGSFDGPDTIGQLTSTSAGSIACLMPATVWTHLLGNCLC